jgi:hypothetical protein
MLQKCKDCGVLLECPAQGLKEGWKAYVLGNNAEERFDELVGAQARDYGIRG